MLIMTSEGMGAAGDWATGWSGPRVLVVLPDASRTQADLRALEDRFIVVECLRSPPSAAWLLCEIMARLRHVLDRPDWPLLFTTGALDPQEVAELARTGTEEPWSVRHRLGGDGAALSLLLLGENVATHPLAPTFFDYLRGREVGDADFVALLARTLAWGQAA